MVSLLLFVGPVDLLFSKSLEPQRGANLGDAPKVRDVSLILVVGVFAAEVVQVGEFVCKQGGMSSM